MGKGAIAGLEGAAHGVFGAVENIAEGAAHAAMRSRRPTHDESEWREILGRTVEGYVHHLDVRASVVPTLPPTWTDLVMWATLIGSEELAETLWAKSHEPLRAALMAAQLCRSLSSMGHLRAEEDSLETRARRFEDLALGLLDAIPDSKEALPLLTLVPTVRQQTVRMARMTAWVCGMRSRHALSARCVGEGSRPCAHPLWLRSPRLPTLPTPTVAPLAASDHSGSGGPALRAGGSRCAAAGAHGDGRQPRIVQARWVVVL